MAVITIYGKDGSTLEREPVDAREICAQGEYSMTPPRPAEVPPAIDPMTLNKDALIQFLTEKGIQVPSGASKAELQALIPPVE